MTEQATPMELRLRQVGPWGMNSYALICGDSNESVLIDPGADPVSLIDMLNGTMPVAILLTHTHLDHIGALNDMRARLGVSLMAHPGPHAADVEDVLGGPLQADRWLEHGDLIPVGRHTLHVYHTPGHLGDQVCFAIHNDLRVIVGDTIFAGGPGKTWSAQGFAQTLATLRQVVLVWPDDTICYPGHGVHFRLGDVRPAVMAFLARNHGGFFGDATWDME